MFRRFFDAYCLLLALSTTNRDMVDMRMNLACAGTVFLLVTAVSAATAAQPVDGVTTAQQIGGSWVGWDKITTIFSL